MFLNWSTPIYRFFSEEEHFQKMMTSGEIYFSPVQAFPTLSDPNFRDEREGGHTFKIPVGWTNEDGSPISENDQLKIITSYTGKTRKLPDAWAFCASTSVISTAKKLYAVRIDRVLNFMQQLNYAYEKKFGESGAIVMGAMSYYDPTKDFMQQEHPPFFTKEEKFKSDLEFRIVILPSDPSNQLLPLKLNIPDCSIFSRAIIT